MDGAVADAPGYRSQHRGQRRAQYRKYPIIPCSLCGSQENLQRVQIKKMIREWERLYPGRVENMFNSMSNIVTSHMMDRNLFPFATLEATGMADPGGDRAFDEDETCAVPDPVSVIQLRHDA